MSWHYKVLFFCCGAFLATGIEAARADEGYLCDSGRIVYVKFGELEQMKQTDACIAGYFGLKVAPTATAVPASNITKTPGKASEALKKSEPFQLRALQDPDLAVPAVASQSRLAAVRRAPPKAAEGTDFRNVQLLNAGAQSPAVFVHAH
jgi:hypothetical protein